ncbi:hypothetical protein [Spongiactinospora sp. TRM90649]|uniref:hypothetical protein n=1 Tax=Spongiactinospora sp. TRM90649 TaxID=3031114 RepID=UPI0023F9A6EC|nr:hypothetical protein [Spongiactinospora sp. TRM90649]MDF5755910.1 hypothetical protein [Spongiactinospora sp. TRM90649]
MTGTEADEPEPTQEPGAPPSRRARWRGYASWTVAGALLTVGATAGVIQWTRAGRLAEEKADRAAVATGAGEFAVALLSYDYRNLQAARNGVLSRAADGFARTYDEAFTGGLESVITKLRASATATVRDVYVADVAEGGARAIAVADAQINGTMGTRRVLGSHLEMRLVRLGGKWRIDEVTAIGAADESVTRPGGGSEESARPDTQEKSEKSGK